MSSRKYSYSFDSSKAGYKVCVHIPGTFEEEQTSNETMLFANIKMFHVGRNKNNSAVTKQAAEKSLSTIKYKPVLASIVVNSDGEQDFNGHDMEFDQEGNVTYIQRQVGTLTSDTPELKYDQENKKDYVFAKAAIPRDYTHAANIIERRGGTDVSVELLVNSFAYNAKEKYLELTDIEVSGVTLLGESVSPGMEGARLSLKDFALDDTGAELFSNEQNTKLIETLENLNESLKIFNDSNNNKRKEDGSDMNGNKDNVMMTEGQSAPTPSADEGKFVIHHEFESDGNKLTVNYEISHEDIRSALYKLMSTSGWENEVNDWLFIQAVYDDWFVTKGYFTDQLFGCKYKRDGDSVSFDGDRYAVHAEYLTDEEVASLSEMRANYSSIKESLKKYQDAEIEAQKNEILNLEKYSKYLETEQFKEIKEHLAEIELDDLKNRCELAFAAQFDSAPQEPIKENFSQSEGNEPKKAPRAFAFNRPEPVKNSFLEGLRAKATR